MPPHNRCLFPMENALLPVQAERNTMNPPLSLCQLVPGESAIVKKIYCSGSIRRRLLDIGMTERTKVVCVGASPAGDPKAFLIRGAVIALRREDSINILVEEKEKVNGNC